MITKILKNVSGSVRNVLNSELQNNESYQIPYSQWAKLADHGPTLDDIQNGLVVVNNGSVDLSIADAFKLVARFDAQDSEETPFDNTSNGFSADTVQGAIEEARASSAPAPRLVEVTFVLLGGTVPVNIESRGLFEPDPVNSVVKYYKEEIL